MNVTLLDPIDQTEIGQVQFNHLLMEFKTALDQALDNCPSTQEFRETAIATLSVYITDSDLLERWVTALQKIKADYEYPPGQLSYFLEDYIVEWRIVDADATKVFKILKI